VPAVTGGDQHGVDVFAVEQLAKIAIELEVLVAVVFIDQLLAGLAAAGLHVGDGQAPHVGQAEHGLQIVRASRTDADHAQVDGFAGGDLSLAAQGTGGNDPRRGHQRAGGGRLAEKIATRCFLLAHNGPLERVRNAGWLNCEDNILRKVGPASVFGGWGRSWPRATWQSPKRAAGQRCSGGGGTGASPRRSVKWQTGRARGSAPATAIGFDGRRVH